MINNLKFPKYSMWSCFSLAWFSRGTSQDIWTRERRDWIVLSIEKKDRTVTWSAQMVVDKLWTERINKEQNPGLPHYTVGSKRKKNYFYNIGPSSPLILIPYNIHCGKLNTGILSIGWYYYYWDRDHYLKEILFCSKIVLSLNRLL